MSVGENKSTFKHWLEAARLRTLPLSAAGILTGTTCAISEGQFSAGIFSFALLTTILLQVLSNFANDLGDAIKGTDNADRVGPMRAIQSGVISQSNMKKAVIITAILALISGSTLLILAFLPEYPLHTFIFFGIGIGAILAALKYTLGKKPYGYSGRGDLYVILFFGFVSVIGSYYLFTREINTRVILQSLVIGCFSTCVLHLNNMRDRVGDEKNNKKTVAVKLGEKSSKTYFLFLILVMNLAAFVSAILEDHLTAFLFIPALIPGWRISMKVWENQVPAELNHFLKPMALSAFGYSLLYFISAFL